MTLAPHSSAFYCPNNLSVSLGMLLAMQRAGESAHMWALEFRAVCRLCLLERLMRRHDQKFTDVVSSVLPWGEMDKEVTADVSLGSSDQLLLSTDG